MNKKGFTLVELLAVIIILSVLALLASTSVTKVVRDSKNDLYEAQILSIKSAAEAWGADNLNRLPDGNSCKYITLKDLKSYGLLDTDINNPKTNKPFSDDMNIKIQAKLNRFGNTNITYEVDSSDINGCDRAYACVLTQDEDRDGIADIGDMITCSTESFYVISNDGKKISMLAQYNLDVGYIYDWGGYIYDGGGYFSIENPTNIQNEEAIGAKYNLLAWYGVVEFSLENYWYDYDNNEYIVDTNYISEGREYPFVYGNYSQNYLYPNVKEYEEYLIGKGVTTAQATLISYEQLKDLGCDENKFTCASSPHEWIYTTSYWTGSAYESTGFWHVTAGGDFQLSDNYDGGLACGVRPVITISNSEL